jgi:hypothetical protein
MVKPTDLQIELVKTFSIPMSEETVLEIKDMRLVRFMIIVF